MSQAKLRAALARGTSSTKVKGPRVADGTLTATPDTAEANEWQKSRSVIDTISSSSGFLGDQNVHAPSTLYGNFTWRIDDFIKITKRELRSAIFTVGPYKWYILVYPNGCDQSPHLSFFLCVAEYDTLLPGWSHFSQFTIAMVNHSDPHRSKYSDTLHRFCKKEHDWGWKKFIELDKLRTDGFLTADGALVFKVQMQVLKEIPLQPLLVLEKLYRRELLRVYLSNIETIVKSYIDRKKEKIKKLIDPGRGFRDFWEGLREEKKVQLTTVSSGTICKALIKSFFNEKEVTSTLVMDSLYLGCKLLEANARDHVLSLADTKTTTTTNTSSSADTTAITTTNTTTATTTSINDTIIATTASMKNCDTLLTPPPGTQYGCISIHTTKKTFALPTQDILAFFQHILDDVIPPHILTHAQKSNGLDNNNGNKSKDGNKSNDGAGDDKDLNSISLEISPPTTTTTINNNNDNNNNDNKKKNNMNKTETTTTTTAARVDHRGIRFSPNLDNYSIEDSEKDEERIAYLGRRLVEMFFTSYIVEERMEPALAEAERIKLQDALIREEEEQRKSEKEKRARKKERQRMKKEMAEAEKMQREEEKKAEMEERKRLKAEEQEEEIKNSRKRKEEEEEKEKERLREKETEKEKERAKLHDTSEKKAQQSFFLDNGNVLVKSLSHHPPPSMDTSSSLHHHHHGMDTSSSYVSLASSSSSSLLIQAPLLLDHSPPRHSSSSSNISNASSNGSGIQHHHHQHHQQPSSIPPLPIPGTNNNNDSEAIDILQSHIQQLTLLLSQREEEIVSLKQYIQTLTSTSSIDSAHGENGFHAIDVNTSSISSTGMRNGTAADAYVQHLTKNIPNGVVESSGLDDFAHLGLITDLLLE